MHYYQHHIGDFIKDTSFLTNEEVGIYLKLLWLYYDTEHALEDNLFVLTMKTNSRDNEDAVKGILGMFFTLDNGFWYHTRCEKELAEFQALVLNKSKAGKASAEQRRNKKATPVEQVLNDSTTDTQLPITHDPEPRTLDKTKTSFDAIRHLMSLGVTEQVAKDWIKQRKTKPTLTAIKGIEKEASKARLSLHQALEISCSRGWQSFKAEWIQDKTNTLTPNQSAWLTITGQIANFGDDNHGRTIEADPLPPALLG